MSTNTDPIYRSWKESKNNHILVVNCGSSSIKVSLFEYNQEDNYRLLDANLKGINSDKSILDIASSNGEEIFPAYSLDVKGGLKFIFDTIIQKCDFSFASLKGIGHRFVHGGNQYRSSVSINSKVIAELEKLSELAPIHNAACLLGIKECFKLDQFVPQIAVFDTAFHQTLPAVAANYAIPSHIISKYQIKRYGFHGISHAFLWDKYKEYKGESCAQSKIITLHLGNGCSMTAISEGKSIDTTMGFTPAEGLIMATRAGDIDAAIVEFLCTHDKKTVNEVMEMLNFHSGLIGISGISSNLEKLVNLYHENEKAKLAVDLFCYRIVKYLGAYIAVLGGTEAIIFSGGIGENSPFIRKQIISKMDWYGVKLDEKANQQTIRLNSGNIQKISHSNSTAALYVIASDENLFIAKEVKNIICSNVN